MNLKDWMDLAAQLGPLAQQHGPWVAEQIRKWWEGTQDQQDVGTIRVRVNERFLVLMEDANDEIHLTMPGFAATARLHKPPIKTTWAFDLPGESAIAVRIDNVNKEWSGTVAFFRQKPGGQFEDHPFFWIKRSGDDQLWMNRKRLFLAKLKVE